ncbi:MAG: class I SAM-dependent methyltransferase [Magnetococcales bacterium]|nr:class I SAM-dependent methyltransferase [Magnetococcales bacterium]
MEDLFTKARAEIAAKYPLIANGLVDHNNAAPEVITQSKKIIADFITHKGNDALSGGLDAFSKISLDFIRLQSRFIRSGKYRAQDAEEMIRDLYQNSEKMEGYYLDGLFLSYAFWPNHAQMLQFYKNRFLANQQEKKSCLEIGVGHGLMALSMLRNLTDVAYTGVDVSPAALKYVQRLMERQKIDSNRFALHEVNVMSARKMANISKPDGGFSYAVCCEVLEHVMQPETLLNRIHDQIQPEAELFLTTVVNIEAEDHVYLFKNTEQIRELTDMCRFQIKEELVLPLPGFPEGPSQPFNYAAVLTKSI